MVAVLYWASALESLVFQTNRNILFNILISVILRLEIIVKFFLWLFSCNLFYFCTICDQSTNPKLTCCKVSHQASKPSEREDGYSSLLQNLCQRQCFKSRPKVYIQIWDFADTRVVPCEVGVIPHLGEPTVGRQDLVLLVHIHNLTNNDWINNLVKCLCKSQQFDE